MRKLIISIATAATLISVAGVSSMSALLGETSVVAPTAIEPHQPAPRAGDRSLHHAHTPLFTS